MTKKTPSPTLVLLDAHAIIHRAYHALPDFSSSKGEPTGALFGIATMLMKIIQELNPDYIAACYDLPQPTHRHDVYEAYKAGRAEADPALKAQFARSRAIFTAFGVPMYDAPGFEADDVLGTICEQLKEKNVRIIIASGDMDTLQLVNDQVSVYTLRKGLQDTVLYDTKAVVERYGFAPSLLVDYKGLRGDPSDNIPGIRGIGEKTATELITTFGSIERIYEVLEKDESAFIQAGIKPRIVKLLREGKDEAFFSKMLATIRCDAPIVYELPKKTWRDTLDADAVRTLFLELEFRTLNERLAKLLGEQASHSTQYVASDVPEELRKRAVIALWLIRSDITNPTLEDVMQFIPGASFDEIYDALMKTLKERSLDDVFNRIEVPLIPIIARMQKVGVLLDTAYLAQLSEEYHREIGAIEERIYTHAGTTFNINSPKQLGEVLFDTLGLTPKNQKKTMTGQRSTRESELEKLRDKHPIIADILAYRELQKLVSTYIDTLPTLVADDGRLHAQFLQAGTTTGRMASQDPNLQNIPIKTEHGRRIRNAFIARKGSVLAALDYSQIELRIAAILSQDEKLMRVFREGGDIHTAVASEVFGVSPETVDKDMRRRAKVINFGILYGMGVNALRQNLGEGTTQSEARAFYDAYFAKYEGLAQWIDHTKAEAARLGYTTTLFGRRRYFDGFQSTLPHIRAAAERMAINAPIQGTQADVVKLAMIRVHEYLTSEKLLGGVELLMQVHDELVFEVCEELAPHVVPRIKEIMESILTPQETHNVPLVTDASVGKNWGEMERIDAAV